MEPVSASTVLATLGTVATTGYQICTYLSAVHNAPKSAKALETEVAALNVALEKLQQLLEKQERAGKASFDTTSVLFRSVNGCKEEMDNLFKQLAHFRSPHLLSRIFHRVTWPLDEDDTLKAVEVLHRYAQTFQLSLSTDSLVFLSDSCDKALEGLAKLQSSNDNAAADLAAIKDLLESLRGQLSDGKFKEFVEWFPTIPYQEKHQYIQTHRLEGSGKWLIDSSAFQDWAHFKSSNSTLFCQGDPGVGKSYMSSIVTDYLVDLARKTGTRIAYFYFDYKSQEIQRPFSVVSCLLRQILSQYRARPKQLEVLWELFERKQGHPSWQMLVERFCQLCSETRVYVVLDALDECDAAENRGPILWFIEKMRQGNVRLFATSRPFPQDVIDTFDGSIPVDIRATSTDLRSYLLDFIAKRRVDKKIMTTKRKERIVAKIVESSQGMFLLATFQIDYVLSQDSSGEMDQSVSVLPKGLWPNFDITMERINKLPHEHQIRRAKQTLLWITTASRPLTVNELRHAIHISEAPSNFKLKTLPGERFFIEYCFGFVVVDTKSRIVRLSHFSVDEYLRQRQFDFVTSGHATVAIACLNYLMLPWRPGTAQDLDDDENSDDNDTESEELKRAKALSKHKHDEKLSHCSKLTQASMSLSTDSLMAELQSSLPFINYAINGWGEHAAKDFSPLVSEVVHRWLQDDDCFEFWSQMVQGNQRPRTIRMSDLALKGNGRSLKKCHVAARYGIWELMPQDDAELEKEVNSTTADKDTPLMIAAERGQVPFVQALLAHPGIKVNEVDMAGNTALSRAATARQVLTCQKLLEAPDIDVNLGSPLHKALNEGEAQITDALLNRTDLDINAFEDRDYLALRYVLVGSFTLETMEKFLRRADFLPRFLRGPYASRTLSSTLEILLEDTDIMTDKELHDFPLMIKTMMEDFWERGKKDKRDGYLSWAWDWFMSGRNLQLGVLLDFYLEWLDQGLDRLMADEANDTILHDVARRPDQVECLRQLLEHGFEVDLRSADDRTALHMAARGGSMAGVELLLASGADVNAQDKVGWRALHYAASYGMSDIANALLEAGADKDSRSRRGYSAMHFAIWNGHTEVVRQLVDRGADPAILGNRNESLLSIAAFTGLPGMVKLAMAISGTNDVNAFTTNGISPMIAALVSANTTDSLEVIKELVDNGADINAGDTHGYTALHTAVLYTKKDIVSFLLDHGANPNAGSVYFGTPYTLAVEQMDPLRARLLDHGGDISVEGACGQTAVTILDSVGVLQEELGGRFPSLPMPATPGQTRQRQVRRLKLLIQAAQRARRPDQDQDQDVAWVFSLIGDLLRCLGNITDAKVAFEKLATLEDNYVTQSRCMCCVARTPTGSLFVCIFCARARFCSRCFVQHPAFSRVLLEQFSAEEVFRSRGRDAKWAAFLEINSLMNLRYDHVGHQDEHDIATPEGREDTIVAMIRQEFEQEETPDVLARFPACREEHSFFCVPGQEWLKLPPGQVNPEGQTVDEWLQGLYDVYDKEVDLEEVLQTVSL